MIKVCECKSVQLEVQRAISTVVHPPPGPHATHPGYCGVEPNQVSGNMCWEVGAWVIAGLASNVIAIDALRCAVQVSYFTYFTKYPVSCLLVYILWGHLYIW